MAARMQYLEHELLRLQTERESILTDMEELENECENLNEELNKMKQQMYELKCTIKTLYNDNNKPHELEELLNSLEKMKMNEID